VPLYQIVNYDDHFENSRSRKRDQCSFVCVPNKNDGVCLANILGEPDGAAIYGIWILLLQLCSRQRKPRNGYLTADGKKDGRRLSAAELSRIFNRPVAEIERCLQVVSSEKVAFMAVRAWGCKPPLGLNGLERSCAKPQLLRIGMNGEHFNRA